MFPNSEQLSGLPDMAAVAEMMQKQKPDESVSSTESTEGAPTENIKEVQLEPCQLQDILPLVLHFTLKTLTIDDFLGYENAPKEFEM